MPQHEFTVNGFVHAEQTLQQRGRLGASELQSLNVLALRIAWRASQPHKRLLRCPNAMRFLRNAVVQIVPQGLRTYVPSLQLGVETAILRPWEPTDGILLCLEGLLQKLHLYGTKLLLNDVFRLRVVHRLRVKRARGPLARLQPTPGTIKLQVRLVCVTGRFLVRLARAACPLRRANVPGCHVMFAAGLKFVVIKTPGLSEVACRLLRRQILRHQTLPYVHDLDRAGCRHVAID
mmetsp:Transcript_83435/g.232714  ORF Transcript_83435/g.232714 Transcript_83435/m.232714 type:complete len:234 (-) Transcript_83435:456-1157(-)